MLRELALFAPFDGLDRHTLLSISRHARLIDVPAGRWLVRRGRSLGGQYFLVRGAVRSSGPDRLIDDGQSGARHAIYPGPQGLKSVTDCRLLLLAQSGLELLAAENCPDVATVLEADDCWQARFLGSALMSGLPPTLWQEVLGALLPQPVDSGQWVIREGQQDGLDCCYVLAAGAAIVGRNGKGLWRLGPGDLFGEDALLGGRPRNASVRMLEPGRVMRLPAAQLQGFAAALVERSVAEAFDGAAGSDQSQRALVLGSFDGLHERIQQLDSRVRYLVMNDNRALSTLGLFLLRKYGLKARWVNGSDAAGAP